MARLVADINDTLYKKFKIIAMREDKTIKEKITEIIEESCYDKLYEKKYIEKSDIEEIFDSYDVVQINLIDGHMIGYSHERDSLSDECILTKISRADVDECKELGIDYNDWLCDCLNDTDFAKDNFIKFFPK